MIRGNDLPTWLLSASLIALIAGGASATAMAIDILRGRRQKMAVMNWVWPITGLYLGPIALWTYWRFGRAAEQERSDKPFWQMVFTGVSHCGAGCTLGDFAGEWVVFLTGLQIAASTMWADFAVDFLLAYLLGIVFQYFAIAPMRNLRGWAGIWAAAKADTISLVAFEVGMFAWMWFARDVVFQPGVEPTSPVYWFSMQIAMTIGFATAFPANWWLIRKGWKEQM